MRSRPCPPALSAARPTLGASWCVAIVVAALLVSHPVALTAMLGATVVAAVRAGAGPALRRAAVPVLALSLVAFVVQVLLDRRGLTVLARLGDAPVLGAVDVTLEAVVGALVVVLRLLVVLVVTTAAAHALDGDGLLLAAHRRWPAGALTTALAVRIVPVLVRDGARMEDARRCRPVGTSGATDRRADRLLVLRAVTASVLDRASDLAATLELRGHGLPVARRPPPARRRWTRADRRVAAALTAVVVTTTAGLATGALRLRVDPQLDGPTGAASAGAALVLLLVVLVPWTGPLRAGRP